MRRFEPVARFNNWSDPQMLDNVYISLHNMPRLSFEYHEATHVVDHVLTKPEKHLPQTITGKVLKTPYDREFSRQRKR